VRLWVLLLPIVEPEQGSEKQETTEIDRIGQQRLYPGEVLPDLSCHEIVVRGGWNHSDLSFLSLSRSPPLLHSLSQVFCTSVAFSGVLAWDYVVGQLSTALPVHGICVPLFCCVVFLSCLFSMFSSYHACSHNLLFLPMRQCVVYYANAGKDLYEDVRQCTINDIRSALFQTVIMRLGSPRCRCFKTRQGLRAHGIRSTRSPPSSPPPSLQQLFSFSFVFFFYL